MTANSAKSPIGSVSGPTATTSAPTVRKVSINENEEAWVGVDTSETYFLEKVGPTADSVFKCADCQTGTIHEGYEFNRLHVDGGGLNPKRIYMCTNCGKFTTK